VKAGGVEKGPSAREITEGDKRASGGILTIFKIYQRGRRVTLDRARDGRPWEGSRIPFKKNRKRLLIKPEEEKGADAG